MERNEIGLPDNPEGPLENSNHKFKLRSYPGGPEVKNLPASERDMVQSLVQELRSHMPRNNEALVPQLLSLHTLGPMLCNKRSYLKKQPSN